MESEIFREIKEEDNFRKEKCEEGLLFPKEKWNELIDEPNIHWKPVSNIPIDEIYKDLPEVKRFHNEYCKFWLHTKKGGR